MRVSTPSSARLLQPALAATGLAKFGLEKKDVMMISDQYDLEKDADRTMAAEEVKKYKPLVLAALVDCKMWGPLRNTKSNEVKGAASVKENLLENWWAKQCEPQIEKDRVFVHVQPVGAKRLPNIEVVGEDLV